MEALLPGAQHREAGQQRIREVGNEDPDGGDDNDTGAGNSDVEAIADDPNRPAHQARRAYDAYPGLSQTGSSTASLGVSVIAVGTFKKAVAMLRLTWILLLCALYLPTPALTQSPVGMTRIGVLNPQGVPTSMEDGLRHGLRKVGYVEGRNLVIEWRRNAANREEMYTQATELAASGVDLIVAIGSPATRAAIDATTKPVVFSSGDPLGGGFAASLARPGGTATGVSIQTTDLNRKRLELIHQLVPQARRVAYLFNYANPLMAPDLAEIEAGARALGVTLVPLSATTDAEIDTMLHALRQRPVDGVVVSGDFTLLANKAKITRAVREAKLPAVFPYREYHDSGALMSYAPNMEEVMYRIATYVDRILRGARPGELPIEQISTYEVIIDLRVARDMHLRVPQDVIVRANAVLQ